MLDVFEKEDYLHLQVSGTLSSGDYDILERAFENLCVREDGRIAMLIELAPDFSGWDPAAAARDLKFDIEHHAEFGRIAIIGDKTWEEWGVKLTNPFFPAAEMRFFEVHQHEAARVWVGL
ncbi:STAS/SEC14 domain-containing protein [Pacificimonas flava]|uniref:STAS/SEC14 domain-containing protein n=1 Tax=Pacificimonas flava TaxID=1234595 RepID=M2SDC9_9SPHN|nr:STAS/SEC14 domain-containing protein [Pacificimonas flava]EMD83340.1 hypothetical protein C725_1241 [Pacificimonas flava]MBB5279101.1 hypothetical protein [Pacificimonas flava]